MTERTPSLALVDAPDSRRAAAGIARAISRRSFLGLAGLGALTLAGCAAPVPERPSAFRLATGPEGAVYREIGQALAAVIDREWPDGAVEVLFTSAAVENAELLASGGAEAAFVNVDVAQGFEERISALARVFDSVLHIVVPSDSPIGSLADLDGRSVAAGLDRSGTRFTMNAVAARIGLELDVRDLSQTDSVEALRRGEVDALVSLTGMPTPAISQLAGRDVRFLDLGEALDDVVAAAPLAYFPVTIPGAVYPGIGSAATLAVPTLLAVPRTMDDELAAFLTACLFDNALELSRVRPEAGQINPRTGAATTPVALHPGAVSWFRAAKP